MGLAYVDGTVSVSNGKRRSFHVHFLIDSGAVYSVLPTKTWRVLKLKPMRKIEFTLADGTVIERDVSECRFTIHGLTGTSPVILGARDDIPLLGVVTLETLGLMINPLSRKLLPMKMLMA